MMKNIIFTFCVLFGAVTMMRAQVTTPAASPFNKFETTVGLTGVSVEYSSPSARGRAIFGSDGIVPFGSVWRTGANAATKVTFGGDLKIQGKDLKRGAYAMLTIPKTDSWEVHFFAHETSDWMAYLQKEAALIVTVPVSEIAPSVETFQIFIGDQHANGASLTFACENTLVKVPFEVNTDAQVMASIERTLAGPSVNDYYAAGSYYHDSGKDLEQALAWVQKATKTGTPRYWQLRKESLILADLGRYSEAVEAAKKSLELATEAGNQDYVRMNEKSIAMWMKK